MWPGYLGDVTHPKRELRFEKKQLVEFPPRKKKVDFQSWARPDDFVRYRRRALVGLKAEDVKAVSIERLCLFLLMSKPLNSKRWIMVSYLNQFRKVSWFYIPYVYFTHPDIMGMLQYEYTDGNHSSISLQLIWIQFFLFYAGWHSMTKESHLPHYLAIVEVKTFGFIPFPSVLGLCKTQTALFRVLNSGRWPHFPSCGCLSESRTRIYQNRESTKKKKWCRAKIILTMKANSSITLFSLFLSLSLSLYIYIYIYIEREREMTSSILGKTFFCLLWQQPPMVDTSENHQKCGRSYHRPGTADHFSNKNLKLIISLCMELLNLYEKLFNFSRLLSQIKPTIPIIRKSLYTDNYDNYKFRSWISHFMEHYSHAYKILCLDINLDKKVFMHDPAPILNNLWGYKVWVYSF